MILDCDRLADHARGEKAIRSKHNCGRSKEQLKVAKMIGHLPSVKEILPRQGLKEYKFSWATSIPYLRDLSDYVRPINFLALKIRWSHGCPLVSRKPLIQTSGFIDPWVAMSRRRAEPRDRILQILSLGCSLS